MLAASIGWILVVSGAATAAGGLAVACAPRTMLRVAFGTDEPQDATRFFVRHWGILIFAVGVLIVQSASAPALRPPVLFAAALEKFAVALLVFFGPLKRTGLMTIAAVADGAFAIVYSIYLLAG